MNPTHLKLPSDQDISGRDLGSDEIELLKQVIASGVLNSTKGSMVSRLEKEFSDYYGSKFCVGLASGSAAIHTAIAAINPNPGSEIITTGVTDMGAITPIIYQGCVPVFADIDAFSYNITASTIQKRITSKTRAILVTHLFGNPCRMDEIMNLARQHRLPVIEDCAQSYLAEYQGRKTGTWGDIGAFSMQQGKHMTSGEGGLVITDNPDYARRMRLFVNKSWGYGDPKPDHYFLALNYRLTELQGAVAIAQLKKLKKNVENRQKTAQEMDKALSGLEAVRVPRAPQNSSHAYWKYCIDIDPKKTSLDAGSLAKQLKEFGIASAPRYIEKPAFRCQVLREGVLFGESHKPLEADAMRLWQDEKLCREEYPGTFEALSRMLVLPWNEFYEKKHVDFIADKIIKIFKEASLVPHGVA